MVEGWTLLPLEKTSGSVEINDDVDKQVEGRKYHLEGLMTDEQRTQLIDVFKEFNERKRQVSEITLILDTWLWRRSSW